MSTDTGVSSRQAATSALRWRAAEKVGVKLLFLVRTPVLARLLSPDDFGLLAIGLVALDVLMRLTELGMVPALVQKENPERRHYEVAWSVGVVRAATIAVGVYFAAPFLAALFGDERATPIIQVMGLRPLLLALASIAVADLTRNLRFRPLAALQLSDMGVDAVVSIALAPLIGVWALVAGALAGPLVRVVLSYRLAPFKPRWTLDSDAAASLVRFGRWIFLSGLIWLAGRFVLQAAIARELGTVQLGLYYLAAKIGTTITEVSGELIGAVAFPWFSRLQSDRAEAERMFRGVLRGTALVLIPMSFLLVALAPSIVEDVLGPSWLGATPIIQVMVAGALIQAFGDAASPVLWGLGQPRLVTILDLIPNVLLAVLVWEAARRFGVVGAAAALLPATFVTQVVASFMLRRVFDAPFQGLPKVVLIVAAVAAIGSGLALLVDVWIGGIAGLFLGALVGGATMAAIFALADRFWSLGIVEQISRISPPLGKALSRFADLHSRGGS